MSDHDHAPTPTFTLDYRTILAVVLGLTGAGVAGGGTSFMSSDDNHELEEQVDELGDRVDVIALNVMLLCEANGVDCVSEKP